LRFALRGPDARAVDVRRLVVRTGRGVAVARRAAARKNKERRRRRERADDGAREQRALLSRIGAVILPERGAARAEALEPPGRARRARGDEPAVQPRRELALVGRRFVAERAQHVAQILR